MKNMLLHKADSRGYANHGWLKSSHSFSFAGYHNPERVHFGTLRVLNDDRVSAAMGFSKHPHDNMEIVSIPLFGDLEHKDSMGNSTVIRQNDVQIMSAGTGIAHSEYNKNKDQEVHFLQIWILPKEHNITPRYDQKTFNRADRHNRLQTVVSPDGKEGVAINQDAWFSMGIFEKGYKTEYQLNNSKSGVYAFVLEGDFVVNGQVLSYRDGLGILDSETIEIESLSEGAEILLMEVSMTV